jgi:hypothetical protein
VRLLVCVISFSSLFLVQDSFASCGDVLSSRLSKKEMGQFRGFVMAGSRRYAAEFPSEAFSMFRGVEYREINPISLPKSNALYIASGPDIFRPMVDFPGVENYHLLDLLKGGWGQGYLHVLYSIKHRLERLASSFTIEDMGFVKDQLEFRAEDFLQISGADWLENLESRVTGRSPLIIRAEFHVPGIKSVIVKRIFLHRADRSSIQHMHAILSEHLMGGPLLGVLEAGIMGVPDAKNLNAILDQLEPNAWYIHEMREDEFNRVGIQNLSTEINEYLSREDLDLEATLPYEIKPGDKASMLALRLRRHP